MEIILTESRHTRPVILSPPFADIRQVTSLKMPGVMPSSRHRTRRNKTAEFRRVGVGGVNWVLGDSRLSRTENLN